MQSPIEFVIGQRWLSDAEPELGLGIVSDVDHRSVTLDYLSCEEVRRYAMRHAPLTRIVFRPGDTIKNRDLAEYLVAGVDLVGGLARYEVVTKQEYKSKRIRDIHKSHENEDTHRIYLSETEINDALTLNKPLERILAGQLDQYQWFYLLQRTLEQVAEIGRSRVLGLCSSRTELIPHQLYIASEVSRRYAPRVMLADEVGLGKTIEAGLILQQQLTSGLATRVLILVPEPLLHQWLVEMLRRFNLHFSLLDHERCCAMQDNTGDNPFLAEQLILSSLTLFDHHSAWLDHALQGDWDLCIIDEAHHLKEDLSQAGDSDYERAQRLAQATKGMLLLTATPEQLGYKTHFALLQLLDPNRFDDYDEFVEEQSRYTGIAHIIHTLMENECALTVTDENQLSEVLSSKHSNEEIEDLLRPLLAKPDTDRSDSLEDRPVGSSSSTPIEARDRLIRILIDQHGTGRIMFRNTRRSLTGFPRRCLHPYPLRMPADFAKFKTPTIAPEFETPTILLTPERGLSVQPADERGARSRPWPAVDSRVEWLEQLLERTGDEKILLICAHDQTAMELEKYLRVNRGVRSSVFHRDMNLVERDRAAAYFAETAPGTNTARILVCSEIGSEGRNFQFCHHLVLFDLPLNPDLLEQRIGRLDRIGQTHTINIHVPYFAGGAQEVLFRWYHEALEAFETIAPAAYRIYHEMRDELLNFLVAMPTSDDNDPNKTVAHLDSPDFEDFLSRARDRSRSLTRELESGRDRLLEINSYQPQKAKTIIEEIQTFEKNHSPEAYMRDVFDTFGVHYEHNSDGSYTLRPADEMLISSFPALPDSGTNATFSRLQSLHREDMQFMNWQHPMVRGALDLVMNSPQGKAAVSSAPASVVGSEDFLIETVYRIIVSGPAHLQIQRFLPATNIHLVLTSSERNLSSTMRIANLKEHLEFVDKNVANTLIREHQSVLIPALNRAEELAQQHMANSVSIASTNMLQTQTDEIKRLVALKTVNPNVRESELDYLKDQTLQLHQSFKQATVELAAVHVVFKTAGLPR